jgi:dienelactone hydrolase
MYSGEDEMTRASADWEVISYSETKHSFTNPDAASAGIPVALSYNKQTDQRSWKAIVNFFEETFAQLRKGEKHGGPDGRIQQESDR